MRFKRKSSYANDRVSILTFIGLINSSLLCKFAVSPKTLRLKLCERFSQNDFKQLSQPFNESQNERAHFMVGYSH